MTAPNKLRARTAAYDLLDELEIRNFPISPFYVCDYLGIQCHTYAEAPQFLGPNVNTLKSKHIDGFCYRRGVESVILYDDSQSHSRIRFTVAHEIGHLILRHHIAPPDDLPADDPRWAFHKDYKESEADTFAGALIRPAVLIRMHSINDTESIVNGFDVSWECASVGLSISKKFSYNWYLSQHPFFRDCNVRIPAPNESA